MAKKENRIITLNKKILRVLNSIPININIPSLNNSSSAASNRKIKQIETHISNSFNRYKKEATSKINILFNSEIALYHSHRVEVDKTIVKIDKYDDYSNRKKLNTEDLVYLTYMNIRNRKDIALTMVSKMLVRLLLHIISSLIVKLVMSDKSVKIDGLGTFKLRRNFNHHLIPKKDGSLKLVSYSLGFITDKTIKEKIDSECGVLYADSEDQYNR